MVRVGLGQVLVPLSFSFGCHIIKRGGANVVRVVSLILAVNTVENEELETDR